MLRTSIIVFSIILLLITEHTLVFGEQCIRSFPIYSHIDEYPTIQSFEDIHIDKKNNVYLSDPVRGKIMVFDVSGFYKYEFGVKGNNVGEFESIGQITSDLNFIFVTDYKRNKILIFSNSGEFLQEINSDNFSSAPNFISSISIDEKNIFVGDIISHEILVFSKDGDFLYSFSTIQNDIGVAPSYITTDEKNVYVADSVRPYIQVFSKNGEFQQSIGQYGITEGSLEYPAGIHLLDNDLIIADGGRAKIIVFSKDGDFQYEFGTKGIDEGEFSGMSDMDLSSDGFIFVVDHVKKAVSVFSKEGKFQHEFNSKNIKIDSGLLVFDMDVDKNGKIYLMNNAITKSEILIFSKEGNLDEIKTLDRFFDLLSIDKDGTIYILDKFNGNLKIFSNNNYFESKLEFKSKPRIQDFTVDAEGNFYVISNSSISVFSKDGSFQQIFDNKDNVDGFIEPVRIVVFEGNIYVLDYVKETILVYDKKGMFQYQFGVKGTGEGEFINPGSLTVNTSGVYVTDAFSDKILVYSKEGKFQHNLDSVSHEQCKLLSSPRLISSMNDRIYVLDIMDNIHIYENPLDSRIENILNQNLLLVTLFFGFSGLAGLGVTIYAYLKKKSSHG